MIESFGSTQLTQVGNNYIFNNGGPSVTLKFANAAVFTGQFGAWTPIGVEQTSNGYTVVLKIPGTDQYTVWLTDNNGNYQSSIVIASGADPKLTSLESTFHQDLNGNGVISSAAATIVGSGSTSPVQSTVALDDKKPGFDAVHFLGESNGEGWHFRTLPQSGDAGISTLGDVASHLLSELLNNAQTSRQSTTFTTADGAHDTLVDHDRSMLAKGLIADLHTDYLIIH